MTASDAESFERAILAVIPEYAMVCPYHYTDDLERWVVSTRSMEPRNPVGIEAAATIAMDYINQSTDTRFTLPDLVAVVAEQSDVLDQYHPHQQAQKLASVLRKHDVTIRRIRGKRYVISKEQNADCTN